MSPRRSLLALMVTAVLVATSCSSSEVAAPVDTDSVGATPEAASNTIADTVADTVPATIEPAPPASAWSQIEALRSDPTVSDLDVALAEFSALFAPVPDGPAIEPDDSVFPSATDVLDDLAALADELTPEQQAAIDEDVDETFGDDKVVDEFLLYEPDGDTTEPQGLRGTPAADPIQTAIRGVADALGDKLTGPQLKIYVVLVDGDVLDGAGARNSGLAPDSPERAELLADGIDADCLMKFKEDFVVDAAFRGIVVHEIVHCWHWTRIGLDLNRWNQTGKWVREGIAAYAGEFLGGFTRYQAEWWPGYTDPTQQVDLAWPTFDRTYDAIGFWSRVAEESDVWAAMRRAIDASPSDSAMFDAALAEMGARRSWLTAGTTQRPEWGAGWTADGPGMTRAVRRTKDHVLRVGQPVEIREAAGHQRSHRIDAQPTPTADGTVMTITSSGSGVLRVEPADVVLAGLGLVNEFCLGTCICEDGTSPFDPSRRRDGGLEVFAALVGPSTDDSTYRFAMQQFDAEGERCDAPPPTTADQGEPAGDVIGVWRAQPEAIAQMFEAASIFGGPSDGAIDVATATGNLLMEFMADGTGTLAYDNVTVLINNELLPDLTLNGGGNFVWGNRGGTVSITGTTFTIATSSRALGEFITITDRDVPAGLTELTGATEGSRLTILSADGTQGAVFFPQVWFRQ